MTDNVHAISQLINFDGEFLDVLTRIFQSTEFTTRGFDYRTVAILGPQSSGKSTILNALFGTEFPVMVASKGRSQTTQGIWIAKAKSTDMLVMDVEGTDSRERAMQADNLAFERKTSLFSLALSQVLIINIWSHDVGRYNAANKPLLKIVFELDLELFKKAKGHKTLLLFLIRDHDETETPIAFLRDTLEKDMVDIWKDLNKPPEFAQSAVTDFFDLDYTSLPHKRMQADLFQERAAALKQRFYDSKNPAYVFHHDADIPADGFPQYALRVWETIKDNKELDIPSQKEMLAIYRCDEISDVTFQSFLKDSAALQNEMSHTPETALVPDFAKKATTLIETHLEEYDKPASRYVKEVSSKKRVALRGNMLKTLQDLFTIQVNRAKHISLKFFETELASKLPADETAVRDFKTLSKNLKEATIKHFDGLVHGSLVHDSEWTFETERTELGRTLDQLLIKEKQNQLERLNKEIQVFLKENLGSPLSRAVDAPTPDFWSKARQFYNNSSTKAKELLLHRLEGYDIPPQEKETILSSLGTLCFNTVKNKLHDKSKFITNLMENAFDDVFKRNADGTPRRWGGNDDLDVPFKSARTKGESVLELISVIRLKPEMEKYSILADPEGNVDNSLVVLNYDECKAMQTTFGRYAETAYLAAAKEQENARSKQGVPLFMIALVAALGFNEFIAILSNPVYFLLIALLAVVAYVGYAFNLFPLYRNVAEVFFQNTFSGVKQVALKQLDQFQQSRQAAVAPVETKKTQ